MSAQAAAMDHVLGLMRKACNDVSDGHSHYHTFIEACANVAVELMSVHYVGQPEVWAAIQAERARQDAKWGWPATSEAADALVGRHLAGNNVDGKNTILGEEVGEVANAILEEDDENLAIELVQVAAVCVAWLESRGQFGR